jgi:hypothetical protein
VLLIHLTDEATRLIHILFLPPRSDEELRMPYQKNSIGEFLEDVNNKIPFTNSARGQISAFPIGSTLMRWTGSVAGLFRAHRSGLGILLKPVAAVAYRTVQVAEAAE